MKGILQEKFQLAARGKIEDGESWVSFESQRKVYKTPRSEFYEAAHDKSASFSDPKFNDMPDGMRVDPTADVSMPLSLAGSTDESNGVKPSQMKKGFEHQEMSPVDDMYSNEHIDLFYGEAKVDGVTGFIERNNYLDRA